MSSQDPQARPSTQSNQSKEGQKNQQTRGNKKPTGNKEEKNKHLQLKAVNRVLKWPVVDIALNEGNHVYGKIKGSHVVFTKSFELAEKSCHFMVNMSKPLFMTFETPICLVDTVLDKGLETIEKKAACVKGKPTDLYNHTMEIVMVVVQPPLDCAQTVLQYTKNQTNNILFTTYGKWAVTKIDNFSQRAENLIDRFVHLEGEGERIEDSVQTPYDKDPVMHVVETIGSLFGVFHRRVLVRVVG